MKFNSIIIITILLTFIYYTTAFPHTEKTFVKDFVKEKWPPIKHAAIKMIISSIEKCRNYMIKSQKRLQNKLDEHREKHAMEDSNESLHGNDNSYVTKIKKAIPSKETRGEIVEMGKKQMKKAIPSRETRENVIRMGKEKIQNKYNGYRNKNEKNKDQNESIFDEEPESSNSEDEKRKGKKPMQDNSSYVNNFDDSDDDHKKYIAENNPANTIAWHKDPNPFDEVIEDDHLYNYSSNGYYKY